MTIEVARGAVLHDALVAAGIDFALPCGGQGRCGRCLVVVQKGDVRRRSVARLSAEEVLQGYALACQTLVESDLIVHVPPQGEAMARPESGTAAEKVAPEVVNCDHGGEAWIQQYHLVIEPPSLEDNTTDYERLKRELARQYDLRGLTTTLSVMRRIAGVLRQSDWDVTAVVEQGSSADAECLPRLIDLFSGDTTTRTLALAVDIGTTTNVVYLVDLQQRVLVDHASAYNGQIACGEDVISRMIYARREGGLDTLEGLVMDTINGLIDDISTRQGLIAEDLLAMTVAGNPTMAHLFLGLDPQHIRLEPYIPTVNQPVPVRAKDLGLHINPEATVDCLPGVGAYVGSDITAGVLRSGMAQGETLTLFIDVGTNGEIVLGNADWLICCACSAGPAFEGAGVASGMRASVGAIEEVWIDPATAEPTCRVIGDAPARGICGSGMISLLGEMFISGVIDKSGHLNRLLETQRIRVGSEGAEYVIVFAQEPDSGRDDIVITEVDIQNLLRAKAAIYAGVHVLTSSVGLELSDIERVLIGGAFGKYIDIEKAIEIGLLPDMPWERFQYLGNTSVQGAYLALLCPDHRAMAGDIASMMTYLELSADNSFMDAFMSALFLPHTDLESFPTVRDKLVRRDSE